MAARKPLRFTGISYIIRRTGDGSVRCRQEVEFEQVQTDDGTLSFKPVKTTVFLPYTEQLQADKKMMANVGRVMSDYYSQQRGDNHA